MLFASDVPWPLRVARARFAVDGSELAPGAPIAASVGTHSVSSEIEVRWRCAVATSEAIVRVSNVEFVDVGPRGGFVRVGIVGRGTAFDIPERRFAFVSDRVGDVRRSALRSFAALSAAEAQRRCGGEPSGALCRVQHLVSVARERRDIIDLACKTEKLARMQAIMSALEETGPNETATQQLVALEREAHACVGESLALVGPQVTVVRACQGEIPES